MRAGFAVLGLAALLSACALRTESLPHRGADANGGQATAPGWSDGGGGSGEPAAVPGGATVWSTEIGRGHPAAVVGLHDGSAIIAGDFAGSADFGGAELVSAGARDAFVVRVDGAGKPLWSRRLGGSELDVVTRAVGTSSGGVVVAGHFHGTAPLGGAPLTSAGDSDVFVVELDGQGEHLRSMRFGGEGSQRATGLAIDAAGGMVLAGWFRGEIGFGNETLVAHDDTMDGFVARLDGAGDPIWVQRLGGPGDQRPAAVVLAPDGDVWIGGEFRAAPLVLGDDQLEPAGYGDLFVARLDPAGAPRWARKLGGGGDDAMVSMSASAEGELSVLGYFGEDAEVDGELVPALGPHNPFALSLDETGAATRLQRFGDGSWSQAGHDVLATAGGVVIAGAFTGTFTIGAQAVASAGAASDAFVARTGDGGWLRAFRSANPATPATAVALGRHAGGGLLVTGERSGTVWTALLTP